MFKGDGKVIGTPQSIAYGTAAEAPENPVRTGYVFAGWDKAFDNVTGDVVITAKYTSGNTYKFDSTVTSDSTAETQASADYLKSQDNVLAIDNNIANLFVPANAIDIDAVAGADHIKVTEELVNNTASSNTVALFSSVPNGVKMLGKPLSLNIQLFDSNNKLIKDIHQFANNQKVKVAIKLTSDQIKGLDTSKLSVYYYDEASKTWVEIGGSFDSNTMEFIFYTSHFTNFAIMQKVTASTASTAVATATLPKTGSPIDIEALIVMGILLMTAGAVVLNKGFSLKKN